jgi:hypothetical protein
MGLRSGKECSPIKYISKNKFPRKGIQMYHTSASKDETIDHTKVKKEMEEMITFKKDVMRYARKEIKQIMVKAAIKVKMIRKDGESVQTFVDIGDIWRDWDLTDLTNIPKKIYYVLYGWFDEHDDWSTELENRYMLLNDIKYNDNENKVENNNEIDGIKKRKQSNTIGMFIKIVRNDHVKIINRRSIISHGRKITITNRDKTATIAEKRKIRRIGEFTESFLSLHNIKQKRNNENDIKKGYKLKANTKNIANETQLDCTQNINLSKDESEITNITKIGKTGNRNKHSKKTETEKEKNEETDKNIQKIKRDEEKKKTKN